MANKSRLTWKVNTGSLLKEIGKNPNISPVSRTLSVLASILGEVAERASEINDPKLNALMCRLSLYAIADQYDPQYDKEKVKEIMDKVGWE